MSICGVGTPQAAGNVPKEIQRGRSGIENLGCIGEYQEFGIVSDVRSSDGAGQIPKKTCRPAKTGVQVSYT
jgi:hypothetical protein